MIIILVILWNLDKVKNDTTLFFNAAWRDDTPDGRLHSVTGLLHQTDQPGTFMFESPAVSGPCEKTTFVLCWSQCSLNISVLVCHREPFNFYLYY